MKLIYSKEIVAERKATLTEATRAMKARGITPKLAAVVCSADPAVASYVSVKRKYTEEVGGSFEVLDFSASSGYADVGRRMKTLCDRGDVHGVILVMSSKPAMDEIDLTNIITGVRLGIEQIHLVIEWIVAVGVVSALKDLGKLDFFERVNGQNL
jgi:methylenetetrahydrofolate dehydrogenase (NADP+)/methenyltetrahydrofolate cyclohydrolase